MSTKLQRLNTYFEDIKELYYDQKEWNECYENGYVPYPHSTDNYQKLLLELVDKQKQYIAETSGLPQRKLTEYMFITVSPKQDVSIKTLYDKTIKMVRNKTILSYLFVFEQREMNDVNNAYGLHMHLLIKHKFPKYSKFISQIKSTYQNTVGDVNNPRFIDIKHCKEMRDVYNMVEYMIGEKVGEDKQKKQNIDKQWREKWGIEEYYGVVPEQPQEGGH